ncbi:thiamine pyrophosphate-dependent dehydrogenase E1 component subunit alpha [Azoarcus sp. KH32C]|uniref:thiamine pyrophosphate-dependent dehydrogenase E1 component subunit alpha n=1 Tax=Azoarcus sp. KH32C TaxID=748247 RepID=UPI000238608A|nr:thiamine pyrophosphate-dependent dehydrogenase E1 component subunit alpha [Azoarcus sp. KH32C]BAL26736.1 pyruvate dehydrogenase E1 component (alpha subunit) oxidoreductase protein [Azoarcus sp. KH32C]
MQHVQHDPSPLALLETMMQIRAYEEAVAGIAAGGNSPGTCTSVGQEAAAVGVVRALAREDRILTNHRSAGHLIARGADPGRLVAEVLGKRTGYCKGKSGSLHISAAELGVVLTSTIVGGELSLAPGVALARTMTPGDEGIVATFFGDGAACEGVFHESLNLAVVWKLPILYVCENNEWQAFVRRRDTMPMAHVCDWAASHGLVAETVDGNDVEAVHAAATRLVARIRETGEPAFLETLTYRTRGHFEPDDQAYVDPAELAAWRARDPIELLANRLRAAGRLGDGRLAQIRARVQAAIDEAVAFANASPYPELSELVADVYA